MLCTGWGTAGAFSGAGLAGAVGVNVSEAPVAAESKARSGPVGFTEAVSFVGLTERSGRRGLSLFGPLRSLRALAFRPSVWAPGSGASSVPSEISWRVSGWPMYCSISISEKA